LTVPLAQGIGLVGLGAMGGRMAARLLERGHRLVVYDIRAAATAQLEQLGAEPCGSPAEVGDRAAIVLLSLPSPEVVEAVATGSGGLAGSSAIRTCVDLSTTGPLVARRVAHKLAREGIEYVDAPVSGGVTGAAGGTLTIMAASSTDSLDAVRPILDDLGESVFHVGLEAGMGQLAKVLNNLLSATALAATSEAIALGVKEGLDPELLVDVFNSSSGRNSATVQKFPRAVLPRSFDFGFALSLMNKDVQICIAEAERAGVPMSVGEAVARLWADAESFVADGADCTEIVRLVEQRADTTIGARRVDAD
jgi:3-hydroxyisobutyrate dehydrogenase-like beta-hydroxyacid dehydrogenase